MDPDHKDREVISDDNIVRTRTDCDNGGFTIGPAPGRVDVIDMILAITQHGDQTGRKLMMGSPAQAESLAHHMIPLRRFILATLFKQSRQLKSFTKRSPKFHQEPPIAGWKYDTQRFLGLPDNGFRGRAGMQSFRDKFFQSHKLKGLDAVPFRINVISLAIIF